MARTYGDPLEDDGGGDDSEVYRESSDDDFNPTAAPADESSSSSEDEATGKAAKTQRKRKRKTEVSDDFDSGDEATIEAARKRRSKAEARKRNGANRDDDSDDDDDDELMLSGDDGGEGGLIRTRAQRRVEKTERKPLARIEGATVDVDALWARMSAAPLRPIPTPQTMETEDARAQSALGDEAANNSEREDATALVSVRRTYTFAGQRTTEDKQVPRDLLGQHLADGWKPVQGAGENVESGTPKDNATDLEDAQPRIRRPLRKPSRFEPNPTGHVRTLPPEYQLTWPRKVVAIAATDTGNTPVVEGQRTSRLEKAPKLNVVDKSRLDWTGFVDKEGIAEELKTHGKTKESYLGRMQFLAGVEARREEERRQMKTAAAS